MGNIQNDSYLPPLSVAFPLANHITLSYENTQTIRPTVQHNTQRITESMNNKHREEHYKLQPSV